MKQWLLFVFACGVFSITFSQQALPPRLYKTMMDSTTSMDVVFLVGKGSSLSLEGRNVRLFNTFFENKSSGKDQKEAIGSIMWLINGREFLSGRFFLDDSLGYVVINKNGKEYVNRISAQGTSFFKSQIKK